MNAVFHHFYLGLAQLTDYWLQKPIVVSGVASIEPTEAVALVKKINNKNQVFHFSFKKNSVMLSVNGRINIVCNLIQIGHNYSF
jgi:hypothetical protein